MAAPMVLKATDMTRLWIVPMTSAVSLVQNFFPVSRTRTLAYLSAATDDSDYQQVAESVTLTETNSANTFAVLGNPFSYNLKGAYNAEITVALRATVTSAHLNRIRGHLNRDKEFIVGAEWGGRTGINKRTYPAGPLDNHFFGVRASYFDSTLEFDSSGNIRYTNLLFRSNGEEVIWGPDTN